MSGHGGIGRRVGFRCQWATVWVRVPLTACKEKGCRPVIRAFELIDRAASFFGNERSKYHGGDFRLQMAEKGCAQIVMKSDSKKANASNGSFAWSLRCLKICIRSDANISLVERYIDRVLTKYKKVL